MESYILLDGNTLFLIILLFSGFLKDQKKDNNDETSNNKEFYTILRKSFSLLFYLNIFTIILTITHYIIFTHDLQIVFPESILSNNNFMPYLICFIVVFSTLLINSLINYDRAPDIIKGKKTYYFSL